MGQKKQGVGARKVDLVQPITASNILFNKCWTTVRA